MNSKIYDIPCSDIVIEELTSMMMAQESKDRMKYMDIAAEAMLSPAGKSKLIQQLYTDIISKSNIDFGTIPQSKGNFTAYQYYDPMIRSITALNSLFNDGSNKKVDELEMTNRLHDILIEARADFEYGYKFNVQLIQLTYCLLVYALYDMIGLCIAKYTNYLKDIKNVEFKFSDANKKGKGLLYKYVEDFVKSYNSGEWHKMITSFKKNPEATKAAIAPATESGLATLMGGLASSLLSISIPTPVGVVMFSIAAFIAIRGLVYIYYAVPFKVNQYIKLQSEFLKYTIENDYSASTTAVEKQKNLLQKLQGICTFIETRWLKINTTTKKVLDEDAKTNYSKADLLSSDDVDIL